MFTSQLNVLSYHFDLNFSSPSLELGSIMTYGVHFHRLVALCYSFQVFFDDLHSNFSVLLQSLRSILAKLVLNWYHPVCRTVITPSHSCRLSITYGFNEVSLLPEGPLCIMAIV